MKVTLIQLVYNGLKYIPLSFESMVNQTYKDIEIVAVINGNEDGGKEYIQQHFPQVRIVDYGKNLGFVQGHNRIFSELKTDFFQLVNQDLILEPTYVEEIVKAFTDEKVAGAEGKIYQYNFNTHAKSKVLDVTGVTIFKSGRAIARGQNEFDNGQYDALHDVDGVDGAACMYRKSALEVVRYKNPEGKYEYFDEDFFMYWEDVDLSWRLKNAGFKFKFVPTAIGYHGRTAGSSPGGYKKLFSFIQHHNALAPWIRKQNYKNHILMYIKNSPWFYPQFFIREFFMLGYIIIFETSTLAVIPEIFKLMPKIWQKRKFLQHSITPL